jgi:hypothetical protein
MSLFKNLFKKGGLLGKIGAGIGNFAVSKISGGAITNLFKTKKAVTPEEVRTEDNAKAVIASAGAAAGTMQALYKPSPAAIASEAQAAQAPFSAVNVDKTLTASGTKSFLAQYWKPIAIGFGFVIVVLVLIFKPNRR